jgi:hypothetical protein
MQAKKECLKARVKKGAGETFGLRKFVVTDN